MDVAREIPAALLRHRSIHAVCLVGSRAGGRNHEFSDWDFAVETDDFASVAHDLAHLFASLQPLAEQWDRYSSRACYMVMFPGPTKVDLLFLDEHRQWSPAWSPSPENLQAIDSHFWDWIVWLEQKRTGGDEATLKTGLGDMFDLMLKPMGLLAKPGSVSEAIDAYIAARDELETRFGVSVDRELEGEVRPAVVRRQG
jgi:hypothetical protein